MKRINGWAGRAVVLIVICALVALAGCSRAPAQPASRVKLTVEADGVYQVSARELAAAGFEVGAGDDLRLTTGGEPVAFEWIGRGRDRALRFYGQALGPEAHTATNVYWLAHEPSDATPARIALRAESVAPAATATEVVTATVTSEEQRQRRTTPDEHADRWTWERLFAPARFELKLEVPGPAAGDALLRVDVTGESQAEADPDHHLIITFNDTLVADATWDGAGPHVINATIPAAALRAGENVLRLEAPGDTGAPADAITLERVALDYPRALVLDGAELVFAGDAGAYALNAQTQPALLWDITDPAQPVALPTALGEGNRLLVDGGGAARRFIAVTEHGLRKPAALLPVDTTTARLPDPPGGADLLIVTVPQFREALQPLVEAREAQGRKVAVFDVAEVNDAFNDGRTGPVGIRRLVEHALAAWTPAPRFLLLAGDASYDPRSYLDGAEADLVPAQEVFTTFSGWTASDVWYALASDDPAARPRLAVGRLPAQTPAQMAAMVAKTLDYERNMTGDWRGTALLVADNDEPGFAEEAADFAGRLGGYTVQEETISGDGGAARAALLAGFDRGTGLIGYFGHGSIVLWAQEIIFANEDVVDLTNRDRLPIVFTVTCLSGFFNHPATPSLGETLLRAENGGAVAALVPSSAAVLADQRLLAQNLADALAGEAATVGEAVQEAQAALSIPEGAAGRGVREILLTFNLLGDPTLKIK